MGTRAGRPKRKARAKRLYRGAKISDYQFLKVLWHFALDSSAARASSQIDLSTNSITALYAKLRLFFAEVGLFTDPGRIGMFDGNEEFERRFLAFHLSRVSDKRGMRSPQDGPDYHMAESHWRFHFHMLMTQRQTESVHAMMMAHLTELVRLCGPVGTKPVNPMSGSLALLRQMDQRALWLERNALDFRSPEQRAELQSILAIQPNFDDLK